MEEDRRVNKRDLNQEALDEIHGSPEAKKAEAEAAKAQRELAIFMRDTFDTDAGRQILAWLDATYLNTLSFTPGDPHATSFNEGQRHVVLSIHELINQAEGEGSVNERP